jgi:hypothetical protein
MQTFTLYTLRGLGLGLGSMFKFAKLIFTVLLLFADFPEFFGCVEEQVGIAAEVVARVGKHPFRSSLA